MLVEEIPPMNMLVFVQLAAEGQVFESSGLLSGDNLGIALGCVEVLEIGEGSAHGAADQQRRALFAEELLSLGSHFWNGEVPNISQLVGRRDRLWLSQGSARRGNTRRGHLLSRRHRQEWRKV